MHAMRTFSVVLLCIPFSVFVHASRGTSEVLSSDDAAEIHDILKQGSQPANNLIVRGAATPTQPLGHRMGKASAPIRLEAFVDFACPFSAKAFLMITKQVLPLYQQKAKGKIQFLHYQYPQPWHAPGAYAAEVALAVKAVDPSKYLATAQLFFEKQEELVFDCVTYDKTRSQIYELLANAAAAATGIDGAAVLEKVKYLGTAPNAGNAMGQMLKWYVKFGRKNGIHVTPTVLVNGIEEGQISSGWTLEQWSEYLDGKLAEL